MKGLRHIGILGHYGNQNLGDEAIIQAVMQNLRNFLPDVELIGFSINPEDTCVRHNVPAYPIRRRVQQRSATGLSSLTASAPSVSKPPAKRTLKGIIKTIPVVKTVAKAGIDTLSKLKVCVQEIHFLGEGFKQLSTVDALLVAGSNQFLDNFGGPWGFPYTLLKWSVLARISGTQLFFLSVGAGPLSQRLSFRFIRWALKFSSYTSLRDFSSQYLLREKIGYSGPLEVAPDLAHSLQKQHIIPSPLPASRKTGDLPAVGINPMPVFDSRYWCDPVEDKYWLYVNKLADFSQRLLMDGYPLFFFPTQEKDNNVITDILDILDENGLLKAPRKEYVLQNSSVDELLANIAACDIIVPTRFHGTVLSLLLEKPMLGICYYQKATELLSASGQAQFAYDHETFTSDMLWDGFSALTGDLASVSEQIRSKNEEYVFALNKQYQHIVHIINSTTR